VVGVAVAVGLLAAVLPFGSGTPAAAQEPPRTTIVPPLPDELDPLTAGLSPIVWQACRSVGLAVGLVAVAGTLAGVPADVSVPINDVIATSGGPVLALFFEVCQQIPLPDEPPVCAIDEQVPPLPSLGRPVLLAGLVANELRALDATITGLGAPLDGALGHAADDLLACAAGQQPAPEPTGPDLDGGSPAAAGGSMFPISPNLVGSPGTNALVTPPSATPVPPSTGRSIPATPVRSLGASDGAGLALSLLGLAVVALLGWLHAGSPRRRRGVA
jgi:hypothetical protein